MPCYGRPGRAVSGCSRRARVQTGAPEREHTSVDTQPAMQRLRSCCAGDQRRGLSLARAGRMRTPRAEDLRLNGQPPVARPQLPARHACVSEPARCVFTAQMPSEYTVCDSQDSGKPTTWLYHTHRCTVARRLSKALIRPVLHACARAHVICRIIQFERPAAAVAARLATERSRKVGRTQAAGTSAMMSQNAGMGATARASRL